MDLFKCHEVGPVTVAISRADRLTLNKLEAQSRPRLHRVVTGRGYGPGGLTRR